jgi:hypothetical protein
MPQGMHDGSAGSEPGGNNNCLRTKNAKIIITSTKERRTLFLIQSGFQFQALYALWSHCQIFKGIAFDFAKGSLQHQ